MAFQKKMQLETIPSNHREQEILRELRLAGGSCRIGFLAERLAVSVETIRRNIKMLERNGLVRKVHGGVMLAEAMILTEQPFVARMEKNAGTKQLLAARVAEMIEDGDSLFLDIGTTTSYVAQALRNHRNLYVVTNSVAVANTLATRNNNRVFQAGGELRAHDGGSFGADAIQFICRFNLQFAVLSVGAINAEAGFMLHDIQEADLSREAAKRAQTCVVVADNEKLGRRAPIVVQDPTQFDILVTDKTPEPTIAQMLAENEISIVYPNR